MIKHLFIFTLLFLSSLVAAQGSEVITEADLHDCMNGNDFLKSLCDVEIKAHKKRYQRYLDEGLPEITINKGGVEDCLDIEARVSGDRNKWFKCKLQLLKEEMIKNKIARAEEFNRSTGIITVYSCIGEESMWEDFDVERTLRMQCSEGPDKCNIEFGMDNKFKVHLNEFGKYEDTLGVDYFKFDPKSGAVQGVSRKESSYFIGTCTLGEQR